MTIKRQIEATFRQESRRVRATLIRLLGDFDQAEEAMQEAFVAAIRQWPTEGLPDNPGAWLIKAGHRSGIDRIRHRQIVSRHAQQLVTAEVWDPDPDEASINDDQLRLIFTCCHPSLALDGQLCLTLREMCGLTTEQVARALLQKPQTVAQRIVRAKRRIRDAGIPYEVPDQRELAGRLESVLKVIYLIFNEGYSSSSGDQVVDVSMGNTAIRLGRLLAELLPQAEVYGLLALMLLHHARRDARQDAAGDLIPLEEQDRSRWDQDEIRAGFHWLTQAVASSAAGPYTLQALIAVAHAEARRATDTDWAKIARYYDALYRQMPSPVVALNRAVAVAMRDTPAAGLALLEQLTAHKAIQNYHLFHAARADLYRRAGAVNEARAAYSRALALVRQEPERRFLQRRLAALDTRN